MTNGQILPMAEKVTLASTRTTEDRVLQAQFGDGYKQVSRDGLNSVMDTWAIVYAPLLGRDLVVLETFLAEVGAVNWFYWVPLGETERKKWRRKPGTLTKRILNFETFQYKFTIEQCFDL